LGYNQRLNKPGPKGDLKKRFIIHVLVIAAALWVPAYIIPGVNVASWQTLAIAALILGFINAVVRPILTILTLPITIVTLGLFYLLVNGFTFFLASKIVPGFEVDGFWWAVLGALVMSVISSFIGAFTEDDK
jgi:putative membrane protein